MLYLLLYIVCILNLLFDFLMHLKEKMRPQGSRTDERKLGPHSLTTNL